MLRISRLTMKNGLNSLFFILIISIILSSCVTTAKTSSTDDGHKITESTEKNFSSLRQTAISYMTGNPKVTTLSDEVINAFDWNEEDCRTDTFSITKTEVRKGTVTYSSNISDKYLEEICLYLLNKTFVSSAMMDMEKHWFSNSIFDTAFLGAILRDCKKNSRKEVDSTGTKIKITEYNITVSWMYINYTIDNGFYVYCNDLNYYADIAKRNVEIDYYNKSIYSWFSEIRSRQVKNWYLKPVYHPGYYSNGFYHAGYTTYENDYYYTTEYYTYYNPNYSLVKAQYWQDEADKDYMTYLLFSRECSDQTPFVVIDCYISYTNEMEKYK